jgi:opacity protein-like surface antigen
MIKPAAIAACLMLMFAAHSEAGQSGDYLGVSSGLMIIKQQSVTDRENAEGHLNYDAGMPFSAFIGRQYAVGLRVDGELFYKNIHTKEFRFSGLNNKVDSRVQSTGVMGNLYYNYYHNLKDFPFSPYVGLGLGLANVQVSAMSDNRFTYWKEDSDTVLAYQAILGSSVPLFKNTQLDVSYRYLETSDIKIDQVRTNFKSHNVLLGIIYFFR